MWVITIHIPDKVKTWTVRQDRIFPHGPWNIPTFEYSRILGRKVPTRALKYSDIWIFPHVRKECTDTGPEIFRYLIIPVCQEGMFSRGAWNIPIFEYSRRLGRNVPTRALKYSDIWIFPHVRKECSHRDPEIFWYLNSPARQTPEYIVRAVSNYFKIRGEIRPRWRWSVVHLDLRISQRIFEKIWNGPNGILWDWRKLIHEKNHKQKISWHCPFKLCTQGCWYFLRSWIPDVVFCSSLLLLSTKWITDELSRLLF